MSCYVTLDEERKHMLASCFLHSIGKREGFIALDHDDLGYLVCLINSDIDKCKEEET